MKLPNPRISIRSPLARVSVINQCGRNISGNIDLQFDVLFLRLDANLVGKIFRNFLKEEIGLRYSKNASVKTGEVEFQVSSSFCLFIEFPSQGRQRLQCFFKVIALDGPGDAIQMP